MCVRFRLRGVLWDGGSLVQVGGPHARPELDAITRSGSVGALGSSSRTVETRTRRAGGDLLILDALISIPARPASRYPGGAGRLGSCLPTAGHGPGRPQRRES